MRSTLFFLFFFHLTFTLIPPLIEGAPKNNVSFTPVLPNPIPSTWLTYHLAHPGPDKAIPADPNCAIFHNDRYHLHYIFQNNGHSFAHVSSTDLIHWKWHPTSLTPPVTGHGMFSGTAFKTFEGNPAIIYHGQGSGRNQIAIALDERLEKWSAPIPIEPKNAEGKAPKMRHWDPDCWVRDGAYWALGGGSNPTFSKSTNLKDWLFQGEFFHTDFPKDLGVSKGEDVSCANLFPIGDKWMLLCISHGLGCRYYLGEFKDNKFLPQHHAVMNWARWDCFAPESLITPDGRRVMWAWCTPWVNNMQKVGRKRNFDALMNGRIQAGIQSLPRELSLPSDGILRIKPLRELQSLRKNPREFRNINVKNGSSQLLEDISGDTIELELSIASQHVNNFGIEILCDKNGENGFPIGFDNERQELTFGYINPSLTIAPGEDLLLRIFIDRSMIEIFANDRQAAVAWHEYDSENRYINLFTEGKDVAIKTLRTWEMKSIYQGDVIFKP